MVEYAQKVDERATFRTAQSDDRERPWETCAVSVRVKGPWAEMVGREASATGAALAEGASKEGWTQVSTDWVYFCEMESLRSDSAKPIPIPPRNLAA